MTVPALTENLPASGPKRELLRQRGQFWTPPWVAQAMIAYVTGSGAKMLFDPAVGSGEFFLSARRMHPGLGRALSLAGCELDASVLQKAAENGVSRADLEHIHIGDFLRWNCPMPPLAIVANPPYIRHHRLSAENKAFLKQMARAKLGVEIDGRAGLHVFFLIRALDILAEGGRLAFILPADTCEGVFAQSLWKAIARRFCIDAVSTFTPDASPFPGVDTNAMIVMISRREPAGTIAWASCSKPDTSDLEDWVRSGFPCGCHGTISACNRSLEESIATGLSRSPHGCTEREVELNEYARVMRGIATGSNEFFFLNNDQVRALSLPRRYLVPAIGRTRDIEGGELDEQDITMLRDRGRPTWLFSPDGRPAEEFPQSVLAYIRRGEKKGVPRHALVSTRRPWYKMETREVPDFLFAYLGRRNARFIRNNAGVVPLTGFLCVYARKRENRFVDRLWRALSHPQTIENLRRVGKSYGGGAIKVEPRGLERLPIPESVLNDAGLEIPDKPRQQKTFGFE